MKQILNVLFSVATSMMVISTQAQTFVVQPYLQDATPNSIRIMWETSVGDESIVLWGTDASLGNTATGNSFSSVGSAMMHEVQIAGLERFTTYYYQAVTGQASSQVQSFKTPPFASDEQSFRFVAMSDMQKSSADPLKYDEVIHDGVLDYLEQNLTGVASEDLALVLIPGDLVDSGNSYDQWEEDFFQYSTDLFGKVPVYPVLGNHESNTQYYFQYFHLPQNGTDGYEEHWWWKDYGNVRFIGLDSNGPYDGDVQLDWLEGVLENTCQTDSIDFVFAEVHHPYKSELWTPGESDFTGSVVSKMEAFSEACGKPSIHFFGHTHGYSRGQSRDHKHVMINVATAGGAIDYWGEWPQVDYDEFSVSEDDWGFVLVEVEAGDEPKFSVKRLSRGDGNVALDNALTDSFSVSKTDYIITTPTTIYPVDIQVSPECVILRGSSFEIEEMHGASHWQVTETSGEYSDPLGEVWEQFENIYFNVDTQDGELITEEYIAGMPENTELWWRVRYRDKELNWSEWSDEAAFSTGESSMSENLLENPGAEQGMSVWVIDQGVCEAMLAGDCAGTNPHSGEYYFCVGGLCTESAVAIMHQDIDVTSYSDSIDLGVLEVSFGAMMSDWSGADLPEMRLRFLTLSGVEIGSTDYYEGPYTSWTLVGDNLEVPALTRIIRCELKGTRNEGTDNDSYFDDLFVKVGSQTLCEDAPVNLNTIPLQVSTLHSFPNPAIGEVTIEFGTLSSDGIQVRMFDSAGRKVMPEVQVMPEKAIIYRGNLSNGNYQVLVIHQDGKSGSVSFVFE